MSKQSETEAFKWPFPTYNNQRTKESQELLDQKSHSKTKDDLSDVPEALF
jgi:hypothetical protein